MTVPATPGVLIATFAVLGIMKKAGAPKALETIFTGESLFNDGVGVVVFLTILGIVLGQEKPGVGSVALFLLVEAAGGAILGLGRGRIFYRLLRSVDAYQVEILLTLALAVGQRCPPGLNHQSWAQKAPLRAKNGEHI